MLSTAPDTALRIVSMICGSISSILLITSIAIRLTSRDHRLLTRGQLRAQIGFLLVLIGIVYGVCESLFHLPHYRLWIVALGSAWSVIGCSGMLMDALDERRHPNVRRLTSRP